MNLIMCCAVYKGDTVTERGLRTMSFEIPGAGKKPLSIPIKLLPSFAAGETTAPNAFEKETNVLINGRLYPMEGIMYIVPTQPLIGVNKSIRLNQLALAGGVGFIGKQKREDAFNFGLMCQAPPQKGIGHTWQDSLGFLVESWGNDADRMKKFLFVGRQLSLGGVLKFEAWKDKEGNLRSNYKVKIRSQQYSFFGKNQKDGEVINKIDKEIKDLVSDKKEPVAEDVPF
ncbi:MAG: hypothetical protein CBE08_004425 [Euryarchaeota archaeon TMED248]|nr:MAG: hypothetical protein CBE08_004425 [Euryarchaeota archaeon TMED248]|tara:strand:+ start:866 stop:1549 length:684 start_codon:yes stop_codon:yes gene_type:complete